MSSRLVVAVSTRALFDLEDAHRIFETDGLQAYRRHHAEALVSPRPGAAFPIVKALTKLAADAMAPIEVVVVSRNDPETGLRVLRAIEDAGIASPLGAFTGGSADLVPYLRAFGANLFLTKSPKDASAVVAAGIPAALMCDPPADFDPSHDQVRIAFDGDSCLFSDESDKVYEKHGIAAFMAHEQTHRGRELPAGPMAPFLRAVSQLQSTPGMETAFRVALVTARVGAARERAVSTLMSWGVRTDEAFFLGDEPKSNFISVFRPHIFFDDKEHNLVLASRIAPSARVPAFVAEEEAAVTFGP